MSTIKKKDSKNFGEEAEEILGYYNNLEHCYARAVDKLCLEGESIEELKSIIEDIKALKSSPESDKTL